MNGLDFIHSGETTVCLGTDDKCYGTWWNGHGIGLLFVGGLDPRTDNDDDGIVVEAGVEDWRWRASCLALDIDQELFDVTREAALLDAAMMADSARKGVGRFPAEESALVKHWPDTPYADGRYRDPRACPAPDELIRIVEILTGHAPPEPNPNRARCRTALRRWAVKHLAREGASG